MSELEELAGVSRWFPKFRKKSATMSITVLQCAMFVVSLIVGVFDWSPSTCSLYRLGAMFLPAVSLRLEIHRVFLPVLLHANFFHLSVSHTQVNILFQLQVAFAVESFFGTVRFVAIYFVSAAMGNIYAGFFDEYDVVVGASTALFGVLGSQSAIFAHTWQKEDPRRLEKLMVYIVSVFIIFALTSLWPHSTTAGHIWGFISGFLMGFLMLSPDRLLWFWRLAKLTAATLLVVALWWVVRQITRNRDFLFCHSLQYLDRNGDIRLAGERCEMMCESAANL